jgi:signal transduction histidine kinase
MGTPGQEIITLIILSTIILIVLAVFTFLFLLLFVKKKRNLQKEQELLKMTFQQQMLQAQLETREETMGQLGKELHDNIGQLLNSTKLLIGITQRGLPQSPDTLVTADETLAKAIAEVRALSKSLNAEWLQQFDLIENLETEIKRINAAKTITITLSHQGQVPFAAEQQIILFRMIQEALQNALKHAAPTAIHIDISLQNGLAITITDNGHGFDTGVASPGIGMMNIRQRTQLLSGTVHWQSAKDKGTTVTIHLPAKTTKA